MAHSARPTPPSDVCHFGLVFVHLGLSFFPLYTTQDEMYTRLKHKYSSLERSLQEAPTNLGDGLAAPTAAPAGKLQKVSADSSLQPALAAGGAGGDDCWQDDESTPVGRPELSMMAPPARYRAVPASMETPSPFAAGTPSADPPLLAALAAETPDASEAAPANAAAAEDEARGQDAENSDGDELSPTTRLAIDLSRGQSGVRPHSQGHTLKHAVLHPALKWPKAPDWRVIALWSSRQTSKLGQQRVTTRLPR